MTRQILLLCLVPLTTGCSNPAAVPAVPEARRNVWAHIFNGDTVKVDLLFVVDSSGSMGEEQAALAEQIEQMARELVAPTPNPVTGVTAPAVDDLHVGVVSADLGASGSGVPGCTSAGDAGILQTVGRLEGCLRSSAAADCSDDECPWFARGCGAEDATGEPIWEDVACVASLGTAGCRVEQPLEASLLALTEQARAGGPNEGFLRRDSLLAVVYITDEDDCSVADPALYDAVAEEPESSMGLGCAAHEELLHPVARYHEGLLALRPGREDMVVVAVVAGIPFDGSWSPGEPIERLRELRRADPGSPDRVEPSCESATASAVPPVRLAELVYMLGNNGILESVCRGDWTPALQAITRKLQCKLIGRCPGRAPPSTTHLDCWVVEVLADDAPCRHPEQPPGGGPERTAGWHRDLGLDGEGRRRCEILPSDYDDDGSPDGPCDCSRDEGDWTCSGAFPGCRLSQAFATCLQGWFWDRESSLCGQGQPRFTRAAIGSGSSSIRFECDEPLCPPERRCPDLELECEPEEWERCAPTVSSVCPGLAEREPGLADEPVVDPRGCCRPGFHCEEVSTGRGATHGECVPDRTTPCD